MAERKYLDLKGLETLAGLINAKFATKTEISDLGTLRGEFDELSEKIGEWTAANLTLAQAVAANQSNIQALQEIIGDLDEDTVKDLKELLESLDEKLNGYVKQEQLGGYVTTTGLTSTLAEYMKSEDLDDALEEYAKSSDLEGYVKNETYTADKATFALKSELENLAEKSDLEGLAKSADVERDYLKKTDAKIEGQTITINSASLEVAKKADLDTLSGSVETLTSTVEEIEGTIGDLGDTYVTKEELEDYTSTEDLEDLLDEKADQSEVTSISEAAFADVEYKSTEKKIYFYSVSGDGKTAGIKTLDATPFIKDGMVNTVEITDGAEDGDNDGKKVLKITFNTDAGKEDIEIPLDGIFNASNYYDKTAIDGMLEEYVTSEDLDSTLEDYVKDEELVAITDSEIGDLFK